RTISTPKIIMINFVKSWECIVLLAFLTSVSLSQAQTSGSIPRASTSPGQKSTDNSPALVVQASSSPAASPAKATGSAPTAAAEPDSAVESGGVGVREFQGDEVGQVLRLLARQAKINVAGG